MHPATKYLCFVFLSAALTAPLATRAAAAQEVVIRHDNKDHARYYDRDHHDYHRWNDREDHSFRIYLGERHRHYREFRHTSRRERQDYWKWRHHHPDHD
ncbi:MAG: hypothetical protein WCE61_23055 [Candidatus Acidiferrum sp.]